MAKGKKLIEQDRAVIATTRSGDDLVITVRDAYRVNGALSSTGASRIIASSPGRFSWLRAGKNLNQADTVHASGCPISYKLTVLQSNKVRGEAKGKGKAAPTSPLSPMEW